MRLRRNDYERTGDPDEEIVYTFFHENGPITLTEHDLVNEYMRLREKCDALQEQFETLRAEGNRLRWELLCIAEAYYYEGSSDNRIAAPASVPLLQESARRALGDGPRPIPSSQFSASNPAKEPKA